MRQRFDQQYKLGTLQIADTFIPTKTRDDQPKIAAALLMLYTTPQYNERLFAVLENAIFPTNNNTGRPGMDLWQIFVLASFRLGLNIDYDRLHTMTNCDSMLRQLLGIETESGFVKEEFGRQRIKDNVGLLNDALLREINEIILDFGNTVIFKKKEEEELCLKTDSFVLKNNSHYPTDYNLTWDAARKTLAITDWFCITYPQITGWRKSQNWYKEMKIKMRVLGQAIGTKGKYREENILKAATDYLQKGSLLNLKIVETLQLLPIYCTTVADYKKYYELEEFQKYLEKHLDLIERRLIKGEVIPHGEKMFSIFEPYTEYIVKGKRNPNFELGKRFIITTNQFGLIQDYQVMNKTTDSEVIIGIVDRILATNKIASLSVDKGFYSKENKELLQLEIGKLVMPKKGKCNKAEAAEESAFEFKRLRNKHSAIESNINELEHRGLDRCPDKGEAHFDRYAALGVCTYNLHRIGAKLLKDKQKLLPKRKFKEAA
jgi:hypothetical protein